MDPALEEIVMSLRAAWNLTNVHHYSQLGFFIELALKEAEVTGRKLHAISTLLPCDSLPYSQAHAPGAGSKD
jgi:hypothetical protein